MREAGKGKEVWGAVGKDWGPEREKVAREAACGVVDEGLLTRIFNTQLDLFWYCRVRLSQVAQTSVKQIEILFASGI